MVTTRKDDRGNGVGRASFDSPNSEDKKSRRFETESTRETNLLGRNTKPYAPE